MRLLQCISANESVVGALESNEQFVGLFVL